MWYRLVIALVAALVAFANSWFGAHLSAADVTAFVLTAIGLILAEAHVEQGKARAKAAQSRAQQEGNLILLAERILAEIGRQVLGGAASGGSAGQNGTGK
jgi:hypothetical protein